MGPWVIPAAEGEVLHPLEPQEARRVDVRQVRADDQRGHREAGLSLEPRLPDQRTDQRVRQVVHGATPQGDSVTLSRDRTPVFSAGCV